MQRKPPRTSWESWIEAQIRVFQEEGAFDNLPGAGKPLPNLDQEYDPLRQSSVALRSHDLPDARSPVAQAAVKSPRLDKRIGK
ncbi:MAG: DUF1992 domain-containing protein [Reyranella sp.]|nr:DUF1992 domain-containing protein [Reyranella sp.]